MSEVGGLAAPLYSVVYGLYNSRSPHLPGRLTSETEQLFKQRFFTYLNGTVENPSTTILTTSGNSGH